MITPDSGAASSDLDGRRGGGFASISSLLNKKVFGGARRLTRWALTSLGLDAETRELLSSTPQELEARWAAAIPTDSAATVLTGAGGDALVDKSQPLWVVTSGGAAPVGGVAVRVSSTPPTHDDRKAPALAR